jgi:hypothetical protein
MWEHLFCMVFCPVKLQECTFTRKQKVACIFFVFRYFLTCTCTYWTYCQTMWKCSEASQAFTQDALSCSLHYMSHVTESINLLPSKGFFLYPRDSCTPCGLWHWSRYGSFKDSMGVHLDPKGSSETQGLFLCVLWNNHLEPLRVVQKPKGSFCVFFETTIWNH